MPALASIQLPPPSVLLHTPSKAPAYRVDGEIGSIARTSTPNSKERPFPGTSQTSPASTLRKTPVWCITLALSVAANRMDGFYGSITKSETDPPHGPPVVQSPSPPIPVAVVVLVPEGRSGKGNRGNAIRRMGSHSFSIRLPYSFTGLLSSHRHGVGILEVRRFDPYYFLH